MFKEHPACELPDDQKIKLWRYMSFAKFISILDKNALFFSRSDKLDDAFEGTFPKTNIMHGDDPFMIPEMRSLSMQFRGMVCLNSWYISEYESEGMWHRYSKPDEGIAIQSTISRLIRCFKDTDYEINIGKVKYIDYEKECIPTWNATYQFLYKRKQFENERELRATTILSHPRELKDYEMGIYVPVNINILIEVVYLSPKVQKWFCELVKSIMEKYNLHEEVKRSTLANNPSF
jgi:hypothetical protein